MHTKRLRLENLNDNPYFSLILDNYRWISSLLSLPKLLFFNRIGSLDLLLAFPLSPFLFWRLILLSGRSFQQDIPILFSLSSVMTHPLHSMLVDGHSSFPILLADSGMIHCTSLCPSPSDNHDVLHGALDCLASSFSLLSLNCSSSDFLIYDFSGRSESHLLFPSQSQCKPYSASTSCLIPRIFSKTFCRLPCIQ